MDREQAVMKEQNFWETEAVAGEPIDLFGLLAVFVSRWPYLLLLSAGGFVLAYGASFLFTPKFTSQATFLPPQQQVSSADNPLSLILRAPSTAIYQGLLLSDSVLTDVVEQRHLQAEFKARDIEEARLDLKRLAKVTTDSSGFVTLQVRYKDARLAREIADSFLSALARLNNRLSVTEATQHRMLFQSQLEHAKNDLEAAEVDLKRAEEGSGVVSPESQTRSGLSAIDNARAEIRARQVALTALLQGETEQSPDVVRARSEIATLEAQLVRLENSGSGPAGGGLSASAAPSVNLRFVQLEREVKYNQVLFDVMAKQYENARLQESSSAPGVQVVDFPEQPLRKSWPPRSLFALGGGMGGLMLGLLIVFLRNRMRAMGADPERGGSMTQLGRAWRRATLHP